MTNAVEKMLLNEQLLRHKIPIAPLSSSSSSSFASSIAR